MDTKVKQILSLIEMLQEQMHQSVETHTKQNKNVSYQDSSNVFLLTQIAIVMHRINCIEETLNNFLLESRNN